LILWGHIMQVSVEVEKVSNVERRLTIVVPAAKIEEAYTIQINRFAKNANIKGFRPGKAPMSFIQQRFGDDARKEALSEVIQKSLYEAIKEKNLNPINTPQVEPKMLETNQPLEFVASFEVLPDIEKVSFSMDNIEKLNVDITENDIKHVVDQLLKQYTKWNVVERAAQNKDRVVIDYYAIFEGVEDMDNKMQNFPLELGSKVMLPGFEDALIGAKAGEEHKLNLNFPEDFDIKERAGKPVDFVVTVKQVFEAQAPILDDKFVERLGVKSGKEEDLHQQIKQSLELERNRVVKEKLKDQIFRQLLEQNPLEVPNSLVAREAKNIHDEMYPQHQHHDHHSHSDDELSAFNDVAKKRVALGLLIAEYAKQAELKVDKNRVLERIKEIASAYESPQEVMNWLSSEERLAGIEAQVMEDQVMDKLIEGVPVTDKSVGYAELKGIRL
jgi:trigger factor